MRKVWPVLVAGLMATGLALGADDATKPAAPAAPPPHRVSDFDPAQLTNLIRWNNQIINQWEAWLGSIPDEETKKVFSEALARAKEFRAGLEQLSALGEAGKEDEAIRLTVQLREKRPELMRFVAVLPTYMEIEQAQATLAERGKDNADVNARCQRIIELLNKRLELQNQISALNSQIWTEREAVQQAIQNGPGKPPAAEPATPAPKPTPAPTTEPNSKAKPDDAS